MRFLRARRPKQRRELNNQNNMDPLSVIIGTGLIASLVGLAFLSGHEYGRKNGIVCARTAERNLANLRVNAVLASENKRKPRTRRTGK
jgi:hypothetical protein